MRFCVCWRDVVINTDSGSSTILLRRSRINEQLLSKPQSLVTYTGILWHHEWKMMMIARNSQRWHLLQCHDRKFNSRITRLHLQWKMNCFISYYSRTPENWIYQWFNCFSNTYLSIYIILIICFSSIYHHYMELCT